MNIRYTPDALNDLETICTYLNEHTVDVSLQTKAFIEMRIRYLADFPFLAPLTEYPNIYELSLVHIPYKIYYKVVESDVWILNLRHTSRKPWKK